MTGFLGILKRGVNGGGGGGGSSYTGPGDIVSFDVWGGMRAYSAAAIGQKAITVQRASDSTSIDVVTISGGGLDTTTINAFLTSTTGVITKLWDQVGNTALWAGAGAKPAYLASGVGSLPTISFTAGNYLDATLPTMTQPYSVYIVARQLYSAGFTPILNPNGNAAFFGFNNSANTFRARADVGSQFTPTASDTVAHTFLTVLDGASSHCYVDGSDNTTSLGTSSISSTTWRTGISADGTNSAGSHYNLEMGLKSATNLGSSAAALDANASNYWGI